MPGLTVSAAACATATLVYSMTQDVGGRSETHLTNHEMAIDDSAVVITSFDLLSVRNRSSHCNSSECSQGGKNGRKLHDDDD